MLEPQPPVIMQWLTGPGSGNIAPGQRHRRLVSSISMRALSMSMLSPGWSIQFRCGGRRGRVPDGFGRVLAVVALLLQIALPNLHPQALFGTDAGTGEFVGAFDAHALCLARDRSDREKPPKQAPPPVHHELAGCCFCYGNSGLAITPAATLVRVAFTRLHIAFTPSGEVRPRRLTGAIGARAPPERA
jgi:hypothetical protein